MSDRVWYRSLYWRIAFGFIALLAALLLAQGVLFLWLTGRLNESPQGRTAQHTADFVARELSDALTRDATLDLDRFIHDRVGTVRRAFVIVMRDGRRVTNRPGALPPNFMSGRGRGGGPRLREFEGPDRGRGFPDRPPESSDPSREEADPRTPGPVDPRTPGPADPRTSGPRGPGRRVGGPGPPVIAPVVVNGAQVGTVAVPPTPPTWILMQEYGPTLTWTGLALLAAGAVVASLLIFRPTHKRLRSLEAAARALGEGRDDVRASEAGGDEVTTLAREFNRMADDLHRRASALAASDAARRQLLADVSHELMTPLTAIRGYTETLLMERLQLDGETKQRYLAVVNQETYKLEAIIGDLLDVARLEGGGETLNIGLVSIEELFRRVIDRHNPSLREQRIEVTIDVAPEASEIPADANRLEQALQNLASNAIRHMPEGGRLVLRAEADPEYVHIAVRDTGPGIPAEHLPHIFDRFYKVDAARAGTQVPSGSGLGLSIVQAIVRRHGGDVVAANAADGGAVFELRLPLARPEEVTGVLLQ
jgi:signal transduction histidine kinase